MKSADYEYAVSKFALNFFTVKEMLEDKKEKIEPEIVSFIMGINKLVNTYVAGKCGEVDPKDMLLVSDMRNKVTARMKVLTAYTDAFELYEYILNRKEFGFDENVTEEVEKMFSEYDVDAFSQEIYNFIFAKMEEGRFFKTGEPYVMVVNRAFADWLGENPIGKSVTIDGMMGVITYRIIGIMENLLPVGNEPRIIPGIYLPFPEGYINETLYVKFRPGYVQQGIQPLKDKVQAQLSSFTPLYIENLWVDMEGYLSKVIELGSMIFWLAVFCILISALGVYSAMMLAVEKRSREMAIRKINGATLTDIAGIFCLHYLKLLIFAACIAFPLIYGTMHRWLEEYSHRITLRPDVFAAIFILMMIIMLLTIGSQLLKIIRVNPTEVLKND